MTQKSPQELYDERVKRVLDTAALKIPDRVPVFGPYQKYPYAFAGVTLKDAMNDYALAREACHSTPSTPGVFFPLLEVTRFTAKSLA